MTIIARSVSAVLGVALALAGVPATAQTAGLECMAASYDAEQLDSVIAAAPQFDIHEDGTGSEAADRVGRLGGMAAQTCAAAHGWSEQQARYAVLYEVARLAEHAYRLSGRLTLEELQKFDAALTQGSRADLWAVVERRVTDRLAQQKTETTPAEGSSLGAFLMDSGLGLDEQHAKAVGLMLMFMAMQRVASREFAAQQKGE